MSSKADPNHNLFIKYYCDEYEKEFDIKYNFVGSRDGRLVKDLLKNYNYDDLCGMALAFFADTSDFVKGHTLPKFSHQAQGLREELKNPKESLNDLVVRRLKERDGE